jgi:hypothetical protein
MVAVEKLKLVSSSGDGENNVVFFLQVARMILNVKGLID